MPWQVGGYATESEKPFDQGSFGTVWRARRISDNARVALKLILITDAADCTAARRLVARPRWESVNRDGARRRGRAHRPHQARAAGSEGCGGLCSPHLR